MQLILRCQQLVQDEEGYATWRVQNGVGQWPAEKTALLLCDVWNSHWCRGAVARLDAMVERMEQVVRTVRDAGGLIVHAPSSTSAGAMRVAASTVDAVVSAATVALTNAPVQRRPRGTARRASMTRRLRHHVRTA